MTFSSCLRFIREMLAGAPPSSKYGYVELDTEMEVKKGEAGLVLE